MLKNLSAHRHFHATRRAVIVAACLVALIPVIFALAVRHSQAARLSPQDKSPINNLWQDVAESSMPRGERRVIPSFYRTLQLDLATLKKLVESAPMEFTKAAKETPLEIAMPMPDGKFSSFRIVESPMMEKELAEQFPEIKTYSGQGIDDPTATMRFDLTPRGFHGIILSSRGTIYIDPYAQDDTAHYISYYKNDYQRDGATFRCLVTARSKETARSAKHAPAIDNGGTLHTYRLAVAATGEYTTFQGGTVALALSAIMTTMNRVNGIYGRDLAIRMTLVGNENSIIYTNAANDPYTNGDPESMNEENQANLDSVIGSNNYDIGHVFGTNSGGLAGIAVVCTGFKANGTTGSAAPKGDAFDVDYVAHEMGHQFGADHTFNDGANSNCGGNRAANAAYEPGSASTIMSYAGICDAANLQRHADDYFHIKSLEQIVAYTTAGGGASGCDVETATTNVGGIVMTNYSSEVTVPSRTPFMLSVQATDQSSPPDATTITWEEYDLGDASPPEGDNGNRPLFRSQSPTSNGTRMFPAMKYIVNNDNIPPPTYQCGMDAMGNPINCLTGESRTLTTRTMNFVATARDNINAIHSVPVQVHVVDSGAPFAITNLNAPNITWAQGTRQTIVWNTANTASAPFNVANVKISLVNSITFVGPIVLSESTPNTGNAVILVPEIEAANIRVKIESIIDGNFNSFFDVSNTDIRIRPIGVFNTNDSGDGSLRQAIDDANSDSGLSKIPFNINGAGVRTINLQSELPVITSPVILDGWTQGGVDYRGPAPLIELNGAGAGINANGLTLSGGNSIVRGCIINRFTRSGIDLRTNGDNSIQACYIGTNTAGTAAQGNGENGVYIYNSTHNLIGDITAPTNIISGNQIGIRINGSNATTNHIENNFIGTDVTGTARVSNLLDGINISDAPNNFIGSQVMGPYGIGGGNVISGNGIDHFNADGIEISGVGAAGTHISHNIIGLNVSGTAALTNLGVGVNITNAPGTFVGFPNPDARNIISGNTGGGIDIVGSTATGTLIKNNYIGINMAGTAALRNGAYNIRIQSANNVIGGTEANGVSRNVISGFDVNGGTGIYLAFAGATGNLIQGNYIGTDATGAVPLNRVGDGIEVRGADNNTIGGTTPAARNIISGNSTGIIAAGGTTNLFIQGNYIGTTPNGAAAVGNRFRGVFIGDSSNNTIGGTIAGAGNVISGNGNGSNDHGITLASASGNTVQGNFIGTNAAGTAALGNGGAGVFLGGISPSNNNVIGGSTPAARNVISANGGDGIFLSGNGNLVRGNYIGTDAGGILNLGNGLTGVEIGGVDNNTIGGTGAGEGNLIAYSGVVDARFGDGVRVSSAFVDGVFRGAGNRIRGNAIFSNARLGIDLLGGSENAMGVTANDSCDADIGIGAPNNLQNYPVLTAATSSGASVTLIGTLNSTANKIFQLDFYANLACDGSGNGEGQTYLGSTTVTTDASCNGAFNITLVAAVPVGRSLTVTATDPAGNTSEFSACIPVACGYALSPSSQFFLMSGGQGSVNLLAGGSGCSWLVSVNDAWLTLTSSESGSGSETITFEVRENFTNSARQATITVAGQLFTVVQDGGLGEDCQYGIAPAFESYSASGGSGTVNVFAAERCAWQATVDVNWITITAGNVGISNGAVGYAVAANPSPAGRKGTITIAGKSFAVKQKGN